MPPHPLLKGNTLRAWILWRLVNHQYDDRRAFKVIALTDLVFDTSASTNEIHKVNLLKLTTICVKEVAGVWRIGTSESATTKVSARLIGMQHLGAQPIAYFVIIEIHKVFVPTCVIPCGITTRS
jgi:hypothetical protein